MTERSPASREKQPLLLTVILILATAALYYPVGSHPFINYDDDVYVYKNVHVQAGMGWQTVKWAASTYEAGNWHPVTWLSHAFDCELFQLNPAGHHYTNLVLHIANVVLLFWVLLRATGYSGRSFMVAALFALHPVNVESVAWIAERKNLLSMLFFLLALAAYRKFAQEPRASRYASVAVLYALGLMAKPQIITFPCVLLLWDYWPLRRMFPRGEAYSGVKDVEAFPAKSLSALLWEKVPLFALSVISALITMQAQRSRHAISGYPLLLRLENAVVGYAQYVKRAFVPLDLAPMYPHPLSISFSRFALAFVFLVAISFLVAEGWRRRYLTVGWLWFLGTLVPMIGLVQVGVQATADRYAYLSFIGLFLMVCWGVAEWALRKNLAPQWVVAGSAVVLLVVATLSYRQLSYWEDNITLWKHVLQVTQNNWTAEDNLGGAYLDLGELELAIPHFYRAQAIYPLDATSNLNIGFYAQQHGLHAQAIEQYQKVLSLHPDAKLQGDALMNMGYAYRDLGEYAQSRDSLQRAAEIFPDNGELWTYLGVAAQRSGDLPLAIESYTRGARLKPQDWTYVLLGEALNQSGRPEEAQAALQKARRMSLDFDTTQRNANRILAH